MDTIEVKKRDGNTEPWSYDKLVTSISRAGLPMADAESVASSVENWVKANVTSGSVESTQIRDKVYELVKTLDPASAENYKVYKKS